MIWLNKLLVFQVILCLSNSHRLIHSRLLSKMSKSNEKPFLILGSGSLTRKSILTDAGYKYEIIKADIDERVIGDRSIGENAKQLVLLLANKKADTILTMIPDHLVGSILLTADQVVVCDNLILEKPIDDNETRQFLQKYGNHPCTTVGSIVLTDTITKERVEIVDQATVYFHPISDDIIEQLINEGDTKHCAGGLMIEHPLIQSSIIKIEGTIDSVMGLSISCLEKLLDSLNKY